MASDVSRWKDLSLSGMVSLRVPADVRAAESQGVDTPVNAWGDDDLFIFLDSGPFVDRLERAPGNAAVLERQVSSRVVRTTSFVDADGWEVAVAHVPKTEGSSISPPSPAMTVVVRARPGYAPGLPIEVIRSLSIEESASPQGAGAADAEREVGP